MTALISLAMLVLRGSLVVDGTTVCPAPAMVQALVLPGSTDRPGGDRDRAELVQVGDRLRVQLRDGQGSSLAERQLAMGSSCDGLAQAAAAVISAMELEVSTSPGVDAVPVPLRVASTAAVPVASVVQTGPAVAKRAAVSYDLGGAFLASADGDGLTGGGAITVGFRPSRYGFQLEGGLFGEGLRNVVFETGRVGYERFWASAGVGYELKLGKLSFEPQLGGLLGLVAVQGDGVTSAAARTAPEVGLAPGLTAQYSFGKFALWGGLLLPWWPNGTRVEIGTSGQSRPLAPLEGLLELGLRYGSG